MALADGKITAPREVLAPVTALTRFRPDTSSLGNHVSVSVEYTRQGVKIGNMALLLPFMEKVEIIELESVCPIPLTPMWFAGMVNNRGNLLPVFDLKLFLGLQEEQASRWLMIFGQGVNMAGLCINTLPIAVENPQPADASYIDKSSIPGALLPHLKGAYTHNSVLWMDINYESLLLDICSGF